MRLFAIKFLVIFAIYIHPQSLSPIPSATGTEFFFKPETISIHRVAISGSFNNWAPAQYLMEYDGEEKVWRGTVPLTPGVEYHYKFVLNDTLWITDPNAPNVTEDEWRNGIIIPKEYGIPYIKSIFPPDNKRLTKIPGIKAVLSGYRSPVDARSIRVLFDGEEIKHSFNCETSELTVVPDTGIEDGEHEVVISFADEEGKTNKGVTSRFFLDRYISKIQTPGFYDSAIMYEVFIRKFSDSDGDGTGDFEGLRSRLDYLRNELNIDAIWLMPFNESTTEHGYNVVDYFSIETDYGSKEDYREFLRDAKERGIKVIMDFVINHTDSTHPFFLDAYRNPGSKYSDRYQFRNGENSDWNHFGIDRKMPKLNFDNPEVQDYFTEAAKYWMDPNGDGDFGDGVDGFRCDAAKEVSHKFWNRFRKEVKRINQEILLLGEVWDNPNFMIPFFKEEFDMLFDYPLFYAMERYFKTNDAGGIARTLTEQRDIFPAGFQMVRFLSNHDNNRALSKVGENTDKLKQALAIIFTLPGTPMIYYGDELGLTGTLPPENVRQDFDRVKLSKLEKEEGSIYNFYRKMTKLRKENNIFMERDDAVNKSVSFPEAKGSGLLGYVRYRGSERVGVFVNNSGERVSSPKFNFSDVQFTREGYEVLDKYKTDLDGMKLRAVENPGQLILENVRIENGGYLIIKLK